MLVSIPLRDGRSRENTERADSSRCGLAAGLAGSLAVPAVAHASTRETLKRLSEGLVRSARRDSSRGNVLELHHPGAPLFDPDFLYRACGAFGVAISLDRDSPTAPGQAVCCSPRQLPFQDGSFGMVILYHVIAEGDEPELEEASRVLSRNGVLVLLGLNRMGWRYHRQDGVGRLPGLAPLRVRAHLDRLDMQVSGFAGAGLAGKPGPVSMSGGALGLMAPLADLVMLRVQHRHGPDVTPLRFSKPRSSVVQSAPMSG